jgi:hypothetical protein
VHVALQAVAPHAKPLHAVDVCAQAPAPLQVPTAVCVVPVQVALPHAVDVVGKWQAPSLLPVHCEPHVMPAPVPPHALRDPWGVAPAESAVQVPCEPATSHA